MVERDERLEARGKLDEEKKKKQDERKRIGGGKGVTQLTTAGQFFLVMNHFYTKTHISKRLEATISRGGTPNRDHTHTSGGTYHASTLNSLLKITAKPHKHTYRGCVKPDGREV